MNHVVIVGCGVVGAAIAHELSLNPTLSITVLDQHPPAQASTGAALGVLMGAISQKKKGRGWTMRDASIRRYASLIPELEATTGMTIPFNRDGIVMLRFDRGEEDEKWRSLAELRQSQGWQLDLWDAATLHARCPDVGEVLSTPDGNNPITGAVHSVDDRQVDPVALTHALVAAAKLNGVTVKFDALVTHVVPVEENAGEGNCTPYQVQYCNSQGTEPHSSASIIADWIVLSTGLGTFPLTQSISHSSQIDAKLITPIDVRPVAGQAVRIKLPNSGEPNTFNPVISGHDIHVVPLGSGEYWVGATVEFPDEGMAIAGMQEVPTDELLLKTVLEGAYDLFPPLSKGTIVQQWVGYRPRPWNRPAPIIEPLADCPNIILATGHYRNGVLLAPATAQQVRELIDAGNA